MKYIIEISYDGSEFRGYGTQPHMQTVQDNLEHALEKIFKQKISTFAASRTDAKVHCLSQYVIFETPFTIDPDRLMLAININSSKALFVKKCEFNDLGFNPRYDCTSKTYKYVIRKVYDPFKVKYSYYNRAKLDTNLITEAIPNFLGTHDFSSFCNVNTHVVDKVRTIFDLHFEETQKEIVFYITGDGFLYNMVRIIIGTLIDVGCGRIEPNQIADIIEAKNRKEAGITIDPEGLFLVEINY